MAPMCVAIDAWCFFCDYKNSEHGSKPCAATRNLLAIWMQIAVQRRYVIAVILNAFFKSDEIRQYVLIPLSWIRFSNMFF